MRILVVEDEKRLAGFIRRALREDGHAVDMVHHGDEASVMAQNEDLSRAERYLIVCDAFSDWRTYDGEPPAFATVNKLHVKARKWAAQQA